jgi:hypothetical protein
MKYLKNLLLGAPILILAGCSFTSGREYNYYGTRYVIFNTSTIAGTTQKRVIVRNSSCKWGDTKVTPEDIMAQGTFIRKLDSTKITSFDEECEIHTATDGTQLDPPIIETNTIIRVPTAELEGVPPNDPNQGE